MVRTALRPAVEIVDGAEQLFGESGDLQKPLRDLAAFDDGAGAPAAAVDDLLVGEHGLVHRIPVDLGVLLIGEALC